MFLVLYDDALPNTNDCSHEKEVNVMFSVTNYELHQSVSDVNLMLCLFYDVFFAGIE